MFRRGWRYYRNLLIYLSVVALMITAGLRAFVNPNYWIMVGVIWLASTPLRSAFVFAHPSRRFGWVPRQQLEFKEITFESRDGLLLFGRYLPSNNFSCIILIHPLGSASSDMTLYAEFLARAGYGVFAIDLRAHGRSGGDTSTFGLYEAEDVAGAVDYLLTRAGIDPNKIGVLGISLGAQAALRGALKTDKIHALVLEGLGPSILSDHGGKPKSLIRWINYPFNWIYYHVYEFMIGGRDSGVLEVVGRLAPRPMLLIASGEKDIHFSRLFFQAANEPKELWEIPTGQHGAAILQNSRAYIERVVGFFDKSLAANQES